MQRVNGAARVAVTGAGGRTALADLRQRSPCKVMFPLIDGRPFREAVFLNTAGGVAGGDRLCYEAVAGGEAIFTVTTQAAERVYRALDAPGVIETRIEARDAAALHWLPQETILFDGGRLSRATEIHVGAAARVLALEWLVLGRAASGERVQRGEVRDRWRVFRDGRLVWADVLRLDGGAGGDLGGLLRRAPLLGECSAIATVLYCAPDAASHLDRARSLSANPGCIAGATVVNDVLICRFASGCASDLRKAVEQFLACFCGALPKTWAC